MHSGYSRASRRKQKTDASPSERKELLLVNYAFQKNTTFLPDETIAVLPTHDMMSELGGFWLKSTSVVSLQRATRYVSLLQIPRRRYCFRLPGFVTMGLRFVHSFFVPQKKGNKTPIWALTSHMQFIAIACPARL